MKRALELADSSGSWAKRPAGGDWPAAPPPQTHVLLALKPTADGAVAVSLAAVGLRLGTGPSGYLGVYCRKATDRRKVGNKPFEAELRRNGTTRTLGSFNTAVEAAVAVARYSYEHEHRAESPTANGLRLAEAVGGTTGDRQPLDGDALRDAVRERVRKAGGLLSHGDIARGSKLPMDKFRNWLHRWTTMAEWPAELDAQVTNQVRRWLDSVAGTAPSS